MGSLIVTTPEVQPGNYCYEYLQPIDDTSKMICMICKRDMSVDESFSHFESCHLKPDAKKVDKGTSIPIVFCEAMKCPVCIHLHDTYATEPDFRHHWNRKHRFWGSCSLCSVYDVNVILNANVADQRMHFLETHPVVAEAITDFTAFVTPHENWSDPSQYTYSIIQRATATDSLNVAKLDRIPKSLFIPRKVYDNYFKRKGLQKNYGLPT